MANIYFYMHTFQQQSYIHLLRTVIHMPLVYGTPND